MTSSGRITRAIDVRNALVRLGAEWSNKPEWHRADEDVRGYYLDILDEMPNLAISYCSPHCGFPEATEPRMVKFGESTKLPNRIVIRYYCEAKDPEDVFDVEWDADGNLIIVVYESGAWEKELFSAKAREGAKPD
jgi:hypothetical protein